MQKALAHGCMRADRPRGSAGHRRGGPAAEGSETAPSAGGSRLSPRHVPHQVPHESPAAEGERRPPVRVTERVKVWNRVMLT